MPHHSEDQRKNFRRQLVTLGLLAVVLPLTVFQGLRHQILDQRAAEDARPNVIIILADDQPDDTLRYVPYTRDTLGSQGITFTDAYVSTGLCCPSRASILTGQYAHNTHVTDNDPSRGINAFDDRETLPVWLQRAGYKTALIGKYLNSYDKHAPNVPPGWDHWFAFDDDNGLYFKYKISIDGKKPSKEFGSEARDYSTDVFADEAVDFIKKNKNNPFFLYVAPHAAHGVPRPAPRDEKDCDKIDDFPKTPAFNERDVSDKPDWVRALPRLSAKAVKDAKEEYQLRMCTLKPVDRMVKNIVQALGEKRNNTVIIYMSDNGFTFGDHRWGKKACFYETCNGIDMIISYPRITRTNLKSDSFALNIDIAPTILDLTGAKAPENFHIDGKSLVPLFRDPTAALHNSFLIETWNKKNDPPGEDFGVQTKLYKYNKLSTGEEELYDLSIDPYELNNKSNDPDYQDEKAVLNEQIEAMVQNRPAPPLPGAWIPPNAAAYENDENYINRPSESGKNIEAIDPKNAQCVTDDGQEGSVTEVGCIPREPVGFAGTFYRIGLSLIGGLALLFIIMGGYLVLTSEGKPLRLKNGKTFITYAIIGLLLTTFGYVFLEVIIVNILHIPGFSH